MNPTPYYIVPMFPYPSGKLHMGHVRNYAITDAIARHHRRQGRAVLHPMGWDAYGLPAENAARENGQDPRAWTDRNIAQMRKQLVEMGFEFEWDHELSTHQPAYVALGQRLFIEFFKAGLIERRQGVVSWDPVDQTVLANEQVIDGKGWRSGAMVEQRTLTMLFAKVVPFAQSLVEGLDQVHWPSQAAAIQKAWIGYDPQSQSSRVRDWCVSRQRSWGTPVPLVECADCGEVPASMASLPLENLPTHPTPKDRECACPKCGQPAQRCAETLDTFWDSSFYAQVYPSVKQGKPTQVGGALLKEVGGVAMYVGGIEHATMHLLYARWFARAMRQVGYEVPEEPFPRLIVQGMVCAPAYQDAKGQWVDPSQAHVPGVHCQGSMKMSKSKKNGVDPDKQVAKHGAEAVRFAMLFAAPFVLDVDWNQDTVVIAKSHIEKIERQAATIAKAPAGPADRALEVQIHELAQKTRTSFEGGEGVNAMMGMALGVWRDAAKAARQGRGAAARRAASQVGQALWPIIPQAIERAMRTIDPTWQPGPVVVSSAPVAKPIVVQVNGVFRAVLEGAFADGQAVVDHIKQHHPALAKEYFDHGVERMVWVHNRLVNIIPSPRLASRPM